MAAKPETIDAYIAGFPKSVQAALKQVRAAVRKGAPRAEEAIKYNMPAFVLDGSNLIFFAGFTNHIGLFSLPQGFKEMLKGYTVGKGSVQLPLEKPMPSALITQLTKLRVQEKEAKAALKKAAKKKTAKNAPAKKRASRK